MSNVVLSVGGADYSGWQEIQINRGIRQIAGDFTLTLTDRFPGRWTAQPLQDGEHCIVKIDGDVVVTGYADEASPRFDDSSRNVTVTGRDRAGDLVDCSAIHKGGHWRGATLPQIVTDLCQPFGIPVRTAADVGKPFADFAIEESESVFEAISRAATMRGLLVVSDRFGGIILTRAGTDRHKTDLIQGQNIKAGAGQYSMRDRYSDYIFKGQRRGTNDDVGAPQLLSGPSGSVVDDGVKRYRPLIVLAEDQGDGITLKARAEWERNVRLGKSKTVRVTAQGWRERGETGDLWEPNRRVHVSAPWLWIDDEMLISGVSYSKDRRGTVADLELIDPAAFDLLPAGKK